MDTNKTKSMVEYVSGGYYLARVGKRGRQISASSCICDFFPDAWAIEWSSSPEERRREAEAFGISKDRVPEVVAWATGAMQQEFGWPNEFYTLESAEAARARFIPETKDVVLFGLALHESHVSEFLEAARPKPPDGESGTFECILRREKPAPGGQRAGFELLATYTGSLTCSWRCNELEIVCAEKLGVTPNAHGFIESHEDAERCAEYVAQPEVGAEPGLWLPWLVTLYGGVK